VELIRGLHNLRPRHRGCAVTIGNFDGVHLGHKAVLDQLAARAAELAVPALVMIFEPQPQEYFAPERAPGRLTRLREKLWALDVDAVDRVLCVRFDAGFAAMTAEAFVERVLVAGLGARYVVVGDDFRFGHRRAGDFAFLERAGRAHGFEVARQATFSLAGERVSSTRVREALEAGHLPQAAALLGYPFAMHGRVAHGDRRGRTLGYPTANVHVHRQTVPLLGVFAVRVHGAADLPLPGVANLGYRPTIAGGLARPILEVHLLDFSGDVYGRHVRVEFLQRVREERRFPSLDALKAQIARDEAAARAFFAGPGGAAGGSGPTSDPANPPAARPDPS
jgi:riboflavin kinase/FMN adenylyltransferase